MFGSSSNVWHIQCHCSYLENFVYFVSSVGRSNVIIPSAFNRRQMRCVLYWFLFEWPSFYSFASYVGGSIVFHVNIACKHILNVLHHSDFALRVNIRYTIDNRMLQFFLSHGTWFRIRPNIFILNNCHIPKIACTNYYCLCCYVCGLSIV